MSLFDLLLLAATLLCGMTTGFVLAFTIVVMPGIRALPDRDFLAAFAVMDRVIQDNDPLFMVMWVGSVVAVLAAGAANAFVLTGGVRLLLAGAVVVYLFGVQLPTVVVNVPLNNRLQAVDLAQHDARAFGAARTDFEARWVFWNAFRTVCGLVATALLLLVVYLV